MGWKLTSGEERIMAEINVTPLTDVMLVLLVIFMVTTPLIMMESLKIKLPRAETAAGEPGRAVTVTVTGEGSVFVGDEAVPMDRLEERLAEALSGRSGRGVLLRADRSSRHGVVVEVLDKARKAGASRLSIATEPGEVDVSR
ncbi:MAG TPA: biopolymer transporter ExbD [Deltaproteobacteria bacterium]|nr:biopolymer transporter ExbD [Deltaproteobacteria bacterium]